jgi:DNA ligase (NAD+)
MLSIANTYSDGEVRRFIGRVAGALRQAGDPEPPRFVVELKIDGLAFAALYRDGRLGLGATRGDGTTGEDITASLLAIADFPKRLSGSPPPGLLEARGEIYMPAASFAKLAAEQEEAAGHVFANPRNAAAGSIKLLDPQAIAGRGLACFFYQVVGAEEFGLAGQEAALDRLAEWGLPVNPRRGCFAGEGEIFAFRDLLEKERHSLPYGTDGLVIKVDSFAQQKRLGLGAVSPNWAVAYKFAPERAETRVVDIRVQVGKLGRLTPVADLEPVFLSGSTIARATLHNESHIREKDIRIGDRVLVEKAGEIIPQIHSVLAGRRTGGERVFVMPAACPACGREAAAEANPGPDGRTVVLRFCRHPACPARRLARLVHFASRDAMDIEGLGPAAAAWLLDHGLAADPADLYSLTRPRILPMTKAGRELAGRPGEGEEDGARLADNLLAGIAASRNRGLARLLFALSIPDIGVTAAQALARRFSTLAALRVAGEGEIAETPLGESTAYRTLGRKAAESLRLALADAPPGAGRPEDPERLADYLERLGLAAFGRKKCLAVAARFGGYSALAAASPAELALTGMGASRVKRTLGPVAAKSLRAFLDDPDNIRLLERLGEAGVLLEERPVSSASPAAGRIFVLTGTLPNLARSEAKRLIEAAGGLVAGGVSRKTDYLVVGRDPGGKLAQAGELGIATIDEGRLLALTGGGGSGDSP